MLTTNEKNRIKDVIEYGLGIRRDINFAYFLNAIDTTNEDVKDIQAQIKRIVYNQKLLEDKLDRIIRMIMSKE